MPVTFVYSAVVRRIIDADTYDVEVDVGFRIVVRMPLRLAHVDAPEHNTDEGQAAIAAVTEALGPLPCKVFVRTFKPADKYGRYLADVYLDEPEQISLATLLLDAKLAAPYEGGRKPTPKLSS